LELFQFEEFVNNITIGIPVFNQPDYLNKLLDNLRNQDSNYNIHIYDDHSSLCYEDVINNHNDLSIIYERNDYNLGAMANMQYAYNNILKSTATDYVMVMHEDDLLAPNFFKTINSALNECTRNPVLILSCFVEFDESYNFDNILNNQTLGDYIWLTKKDLVELYLDNQPIAFGSALYAVSNYPELNFDFQRFGEFSDRPLLLDGVGEGDVILLLRGSMYFSRSHVSNDRRWRMLKPSHVYNLLNYYLKILSCAKDFERAEFNKRSTRFALDSYRNLQLSGNEIPWFFYVIQGLTKDVVSVKYLFLKFNVFNRLVTWCFKRN
jgi:glycosyltransferase involved in cell wall biosynthesis